MLTLHLTLTNNQVIVRVNGKESHQFSLLDLSQSEQEWKDFYKNPRAYGEKLFNALFRDSARMEFDALSKQTERMIVLVLESPELDGVAWEYAYNKAKEEYVVEDCAFVRALPESERPANGRMKNEVERVPLLFIPANPLVDLSGEPMRPLDVDGEWREMKRHIEKSNAPFDMLELRPATPEALQSVMARFQNGMIAHFSGHGAATRDGAILLFERENGASNPLEAREFVREIKDKAWIGFLSACQSAVPERTEFSNLARELVKAGVPFALGMQFNLPDPFAPNISGQFYNYLAHGHAVPEAARQARRAVKRENEFFVGMIALYAAHPDEVGKLVWRGSGAQTVSLFRPADVSDLPSPASGLIGRQRELMRIGTRLLEGKKPLTVTLHGAGGIGKTALLWQALLRFAPSFELTLAIGLDPLPSLESVLGRIERFLGLPSPCSNDTQEREALVRNALTSKRTLLGLDNFETLNYALNEKGSDEEKTAKRLHTFFKSLAANGVTLCVTSREVTNLPGETIEEIQGLSNENGGRLFQENVVGQKDEIYIEKTQQVSEMVGGHPLALRLLASAFDDQVGTSLDQYIENLQSFLPKARDKWTEEDRHESLRASFDFTMNNLVKTEEGKELQIALSRLSVFIAFFVNFTAAPVIENYFPEENKELVRMMPKASNILLALWKHGLLERSVIESPDERIYLYRLHSALGVFAKERVTDFEAVKENYWKSMNNLTRIAIDEIKKSPLMAQIALRAVPDLLVSAESRNDEYAARMQNRVGSLFWQFGLYDDALRFTQKSIVTHEHSNNLKGLSAAIHNMAVLQTERGDLDGAMTLFQRSLAIKEELGDPRDKSTTIVMMAQNYRMRGDLDGAMKLCKQSLEIFDELGDLEGKAVALGEIASIYIARGDMEKGLALNQEKLEIVRNVGNKREESVALVWIAVIERSKGNLDKALSLYQEALDIGKELGDAKIQLSAYEQMASINITRGDLNEVLEQYKQALEIVEKLGDLKGKSTMLSNIGVVLGRSERYEDALKSLLSALEIQIQLQAELDIKNTISLLNQFQQGMGVEVFKKLWKKVTGSEQLPEWLNQSPEQEQGMTIEQFIAEAIQSAREKRPEAEEYFKSAQKMAADSSVPAEMRELGRVLSRIMIGDKKVDLSRLPENLAEAIRTELQ
jgi:tetratricopeptide (TPR) repeat protein